LRLLADENVHAMVVGRLRAAGLAVDWIAELSPGVSDELILLRADIGEMTLITYDRDFGDLIFNRGHPRPHAIIYSRLGRAEPRYIADRIERLVKRGVPAGHFVTIGRDKNRSKPFPSGADNV
jgi:predicted nuclease of predicted toxin-antitoxin system